MPEPLPPLSRQPRQNIHEDLLARHIHHRAGVDPAPRAPGEPDTALKPAGPRRIDAIPVPADHCPAGDTHTPVTVLARLPRPGLHPIALARPCSSSCHARHPLTPPSHHKAQTLLDAAPVRLVMTAGAGLGCWWDATRTRSLLPA